MIWKECEPTLIKMIQQLNSQKTFKSWRPIKVMKMHKIPKMVLIPKTTKVKRHRTNLAVERRSTILQTNLKLNLKD